MSDLVESPNRWFSHAQAHMILLETNFVFEHQIPRTIRVEFGCIKELV